MAWAFIVFALACGARTDLGSAVSIAPPDGGSTSKKDAATSTCQFSEPTSIAQGAANVDVRLAGDFVYWNDGARIMRVAKSGGASEVVATALVNPGAFDASTGGVVFAAHGDAKVMLAPSSLVAVLPHAGIEALAAAPNGHVYAVAPAGPFEALYDLHDGYAALVTTLSFSTPDALPLGAFPQSAYGFFVDATNAYVSFIGFAPNASRVVSVNLVSGNVTTLSAAPLSLPGTTLVLDSQYVYYASSFGSVGPSIDRVPLASGDAGAIASTPTYCTDCARTILASDDANVYFSSGELGQNVAAVPKSGGATPNILWTAKSKTPVSGIASDGACVYWVATNDAHVYVAPRLP